MGATMNVSYDEARAFCVEHYAKRGMDTEYWNCIIPTDPVEVFRIYMEILKEIEESKRIKITEEVACGLTIRKTTLIDDPTPANSQ